MSAPASLIINRAHQEPTRHWSQASDGTLKLVDHRRDAGYEIFDVRANTRRVEPLPLVNAIRERVAQWRASGYEGTTIVSRQLLEHWHDTTARQHPFYFCQLEAIETLIWWVEALPNYKQGIHVPGDGGEWQRLCNKMATGSGKTTLMGMVIVWQTLNALTYPKRNKDFSRAIFVVAPGLTVKERLRTLYPGDPANVYDEFRICPNESLRQKLNQVELLVENWHTLMPLKQTERSVVKKGKESDEAYTRRVLGKLAQYKDLVVINDEAHHAYRVPAESKVSKKEAEEHGIDLEEATRWIEGLDRIHKTRRVQRCFDLSATPFAPTGKKATEAGLFGWVVSDFGLNDAIESGLVKTPRVVIRDDALPDAKTYRSRLYHIYRDAEVQNDLSRRGAEPHEPLPQLVQTAYTLLGADWREAYKAWKEAGHTSPPVMLTVCNKVETSARIEHYFNKGDAHWPELHAPGRTLRVDSRVLEKAERGETATADKDYEKRLKSIVDAASIPDTKKEQLKELKKEELLRALVDNVGKRGQGGQDLQNVISVAMLSEGWDAKNVTHIMGLRAFTSQLLCEQVIGRGLRRVGYDKDEEGYYKAEYVNIFGVPLSIFQDMSEAGDAPPPPKPSTQIEAMPERNALEIRWPNVVRIDTIIRPELVVDWTKVAPLQLDPSRTAIIAELAPAVGGATDMSKVKEIDLEKIPEGFRQQHLVFKAARKAYDDARERFKGQREFLVVQLIRIVEQFLDGPKLVIPTLFHQKTHHKRILIALNLDLIVQHLMRHVNEQNSERIEPVFDEEFPIGSTRSMRTWYTTKHAPPTRRSQVSHAVADGTWEQYTMDALESKRTDGIVQSYAKNDHLGFQIQYLFNGSRRRYIPDYLVRFTNGKTLVLEIKGQDSEQNRAKRAALDQWVKAVNTKGGFGTWCWDVALRPEQVWDVVMKHGDLSPVQYREHDVVMVLRDVQVEGHHLRAGLRGTVVAVYGNGKAYAVEFTDLANGMDVVTMEPGMLK
jgi:type III restriction enzyme